MQRQVGMPENIEDRASFLASIKKIRFLSRQRFETKLNALVRNSRQGQFQGADRVSSRLGMRGAGRNAPLGGRAKDQKIAAKITAAMCQLDKVIRGALLCRQVSCGQMQSFCLGEQPV